MQLLEFMYVRDSINDFAKDRRYSGESDQSVLKSSDKRKVRLTLRQINKLRLQSEAHDVEVESEKDFIKQMYGQPPKEQGAQ